jgi:hypothetical protein
VKVGKIGQVSIRSCCSLRVMNIIANERNVILVVMNDSTIPRSWVICVGIHLTCIDSALV